MQLGFVSAILPELSLEEVLAFAADEGFACVELMCWPPGAADRRYAGVTHIDVTAFTDEQAGRILDLVQRYGVAISGLGYYPNPLDADAAHREFVIGHLKKVISAAPRINVRLVNTFIGRDHTRSLEANWTVLRTVWPDIIRHAEAEGVNIGIENCPMLFSMDEWPGGKNLMTTPAIWRRAFADIPSKHFGLNFDPSHFVLQFMDPTAPLEEFQDKLFHLHAKDVRIRKERLDEVGIFAYPLEWHQPRIPGYGDIDWAQFMAALQAIDYQGAVCIEVEDGTFGSTLQGRQRALRVARNVLQPFFD